MINSKILIEYQNAKKELSKWKRKELELRNKIVDNYKYESREGIHHFFFDGKDTKCEIDVTLKLNRTLDQDAIETLWNDLSQDERDILSYSFRLDLKGYKKLVEEKKIGRLSKAITEKPGTPGLKLNFTE